MRPPRPAARGLLAPLLAALWLGAAGAHAGEVAPAADVTESGRNLDRALDVVLAGPGSAPAGGRTLVVLLDPSASLQAAGFGDRFAAALTRNAGRLSGTAIGVGRCGAKDPLVLAPSRDPAVVAQAVRNALVTPDPRIQNLCADLRAVAGSLRGADGDREVLLVTLENGDYEDDLEGTVSALLRAKVRVHVVSKEAFLADSYWLSHPATKVPKGGMAVGGDGAFAEMPWGWLWQMTIGNEAAPSGYAPFALSRIAQGTGGRVFLWGGSTAGKHVCTTYGLCAFCDNGDHAPPGEAYRSQRVKALAPLVGPREAVFETAARDPYTEAVLAAWAAAADAGLIRSRPPVEDVGGTLKPSRKTQAAWLPLLGSATGLPRQAAKAEEAVKAADRILAALEAAMAKAEGKGGERSRAVADTTRMMLLVTRTNLVAFAGWCREAGPEMLAKQREGLLPPEQPWFGPEVRVTGVGYTPVCLCHGVKPFLEVHLPGGEAVRAALRALDEAYVAFSARYDHTPWGVAVRRSGLARFYPAVQAKVVPLPPRDLSGSDTQEPDTTAPSRPGREDGGGVDKGGGGPVTGGD